MNKRIPALLCLVMITALLLCGCRCEPHSTNWYVQSFQKVEVFVNGGEYLLAHNGYPSVRDPFAGMKDGFVAISFSENGSMLFAPGNGEVLTGKYTYEHQGLRETKVYVQLDNGETFTCTARSNPYGSTLTCSFRQMDYLFEDIRVDPKDYYDESQASLRDAIRLWVTDTDGDFPVKRCRIQLINGYYVLISEELNGHIRLDEKVAVRCFHMDVDDQLTAMDVIVEGECFFAGETINEIVYVTLYYVEFP